jgi:hypothetical protein
MIGRIYARNAKRERNAEIRSEKVTTMRYRYLFAFEVRKLDEKMFVEDDKNGHM